MELKYFYYISEPKVRMLSAQFAQSNSTFGLNPKIEFAGFSIGVDFKSQSAEKNNLVGETILLLKNLHKKKAIHSLDPNDIANENKEFLLEDTGNWQHGISQISYSQMGKEHDYLTHERLLTYVVWKKQGRIIYLLVGSPHNILGEKVIESSYIIAPGTLRIIRDFGEIKLSRAGNFQRIILDLEKDKWAQGEKYTFYIDERFNDLISEYKVADNFLIIGEDHDRVTRMRNEDYKGEVLLMYCNEALGSLPNNRLNIVFKIFQKLPVRYLGIDTIYLGSPLYTAII